MMARAYRWLATLCCICSMLGCGGRSSLLVPSDDASDDASRTPPTTQPPIAPSNVHASTTLEDRVHVTFELLLTPDSGSAVTGFALLRDGMRIATLDLQTTSFDDLTVEPGTFAAPRELKASQGDDASTVTLSWQAPATHAPSDKHVYTVVAFAGSVPSAPSAPAIGRRAAPTLTGYDLTRDDERSWISLTGTATSHRDVDAPAAQLDPGAAFAEPLVWPLGAIRLQVVDLKLTAANAIYRVRARGRDVVGPSSDAAIGYRAPPLGAPRDAAESDKSSAPRYQWQRSVDELDSKYIDLPDATGPSWFDASLPPATTRFYRASVSVGNVQAFTRSTRVTSRPGVKQLAHDSSRCALFDDGSVQCWSGAYDGLPSGPFAGPFTQVSVSDSRACGLQTDGHMICWGRGIDFNSIAPTTPTKTAYSMIALGGEANCMLRSADQRLDCLGQLGEYVNVRWPKNDTFSSITIGYERICGVRTNGSLWCWGPTDPDSPPQTAGTKYMAVSADSWGVSALREDGTLSWWPGNQAETAPLGSDKLRFKQLDYQMFCALTTGGQRYCWTTDTPFPGKLYKKPLYRAIDGGCGIRLDGRVDCDNGLNYGLPPDNSDHKAVELMVIENALCIADAEHALRCQDVDSAFYNIPVDERPKHALTIVSASGGRVCALLPEGSVKCWLQNSYFPELTLPSDLPYREIAVTDARLCGIASDGTLRCVGTLSVDTPPPSITLAHYSQLSAGYTQLCALDEDGIPHCWGTGNLSAVPDAATAMPAKLLETGWDNACVIRQDDKLVCWGGNGYGEAPAGPVDIGKIVKLAATYQQTCGLRDDGHIVCLGAARMNDRGVSLGTYSKLAANGGRACGLRDDGKIVCWGYYPADDGAPLVVP